MDFRDGKASQQQQQTQTSPVDLTDGCCSAGAEVTTKQICYH